MGRQRTRSLLGLEIGIPCGGFSILVIEDGADQM